MRNCGLLRRLSQTPTVTSMTWSFCERMCGRCTDKKEHIRHLQLHTLVAFLFVYFHFHNSARCRMALLRGGPPSYRDSSRCQRPLRDTSNKATAQSAVMHMIFEYRDAVIRPGWHATVYTDRKGRGRGRIERAAL